MLDSTFPFSDVPWLRHALALAVTFFVMWLVVSPPAYVVYKVLHAMRERLETILSGIAERFAGLRKQRLERRNKQRHRALAGNLIHKRDHTNIGVWDESIAAIIRPVT